MDFLDNSPDVNIDNVSQQSKLSKFAKDKRGSMDNSENFLNKQEFSIDMEAAKSGVSIEKTESTPTVTDDQEKAIREIREDIVEMRKLYRNLKDMVDPLQGITMLAMRV